MPFDASTSDYFETKPAPVYDAANPPSTMAEAIRMAVADVEAQEAAGVEYSWTDCTRCTAGAVVRALGGTNWLSFGERWTGVFGVLSVISIGWSRTDLRWIMDESRSHIRDWKAAKFGPVPNVSLNITPYYENPTAFKRDMLALADRLEREAGQ